MWVCAGNGEDFSFAKSIGVGLVDSASNLCSLCLREKIDELIFLGSAGAYSKDIALLDLFVADSATQIELSFLQRYSYTPIDNKIDSNIFDESNKVSRISNVSYETLGFKKSIVNSSNYISTNKHLALQFYTAGIGLENMEFFAVMRVAQYFCIPCFGVFCVSNYCDENAHRDFMHYHHDVKERLTQAAKDAKNFYKQFVRAI